MINNIQVLNNKIVVVNNKLTSFPLGASLFGGVIAYIFSTTDFGYVSGKTSGIVVALTDSTPTIWGCYNTLIGGTSSAIGYGLINTNIIKASCLTTNAALVASQHSNDGYTDWFLGSEGDFTAICANKEVIPNLQVYAGAGYWTSTENIATTAQGKYFNNCASGNRSKNGSDFIRPIRYFSV